jgi:hypothetical protein
MVAKGIGDFRLRLALIGRHFKCHNHKMRTTACQSSLIETATTCGWTSNAECGFGIREDVARSHSEHQVFGKSPAQK